MFYRMVWKRLMIDKENSVTYIRFMLILNLQNLHAYRILIICIEAIVSQFTEIMRSEF